MIPSEFIALMASDAAPDLREAAICSILAIAHEPADGRLRMLSFGKSDAPAIETPIRLTATAPSLPLQVRLVQVLQIMGWNGNVLLVLSDGVGIGLVVSQGAVLINVTRDAGVTEVEIGGEVPDFQRRAPEQAFQSMARSTDTANEQNARMLLRPTTTEDLFFIQEFDLVMFAEDGTYPFSRPILHYHAARVLGRQQRVAPQCERLTAPPVWPWLSRLLSWWSRQSNERTFLPQDMRFFTLLWNKKPAGLLVLRDWPDRSKCSGGRYDGPDGEIYYLGVAPTFRRAGLGNKALQFALDDNARRHRHGTTFARFKQSCSVFRAMLESAGFEFYPWPRDERIVGHRYSDETLIKIPHADSP